MITFVAWLIAGDLQEAVERTITVLVIACPHALGLAIPLVIAISTASAARAGILVKDRLALERMRRVDAVLFDKTGTLTKGEPAVVDAVAAVGDTDRLLALAGAAEADSEHPLARAVVAAADEARPGAGPDRVPLDPGTGRDRPGGRAAWSSVGGPGTVSRCRPRSGRRRAAARALEAERQHRRLRVSDGEVVGALALADEIRPTSRQADRRSCTTAASGSR